jgi:hypothetical protein
MVGLADKVDLLLQEQEKELETNYPQELIDAVEKILERNDSLPRTSRSRVSIARAVSFFRDNGYGFGKEVLRRIAVEKLGRKGWANA